MPRRAGRKPSTCGPLIPLKGGSLVFITQADAEADVEEQFHRLHKTVDQVLRRLDGYVSALTEVTPDVFGGRWKKQT